MKSRLTITAGLLTTIICIGFPGFLAAMDRPNIVLILADDLGWADLGCQGGDLVETPNIDQLARDGVRFTQAYAAAPVCTPTRAALMTGKAPARLHMTVWSEETLRRDTSRKLIAAESHHNLDLDEITIAERLHDAGYLTAAIGKWHLGDADHFPETQGFDVNIAGNHWGAPATFFYPYRKAGRFGPGIRYVPHMEFGKPGEYLTDRLTDEALNTIDRVQGKPFFLYLAHYAVHTPLEAKQADVDKFQSKASGALRHRNTTYAAMVKSLDESVGRIRKHLVEKGIERETVFIFTSDNGGVSRNSPADGHFTPVTDNYPLRSGKGCLYEGGIRVPLIIFWPDVTAAGQSIEQPVISTDLHRTLASIAKLPGHSDSEPVGPLADGIDLTPLLRDSTKSLSRNELMFHYPHYYYNMTPASAIRSGDWKLIKYYEDNSRELYHLGKDPGEIANHVDIEPEIANELERRLELWLRDTKAALPTLNSKFN